MIDLVPPATRHRNRPSFAMVASGAFLDLPGRAAKTYRSDETVFKAVVVRDNAWEAKRLVASTRGRDWLNRRPASWNESAVRIDEPRKGTRRDEIQQKALRTTCTGQTFRWDTTTRNRGFGGDPLGATPRARGAFGKSASTAPPNAAAAKRRRRRAGAFHAPARNRGFSPGNSRRHDTRHAWVWSPSHCLHETVRRERCGAERLDEQHGGCFLGNPPGKVRGDAERKRGVETNTSAFGAVAPCVKKSTLRLTRATRSCQAATH